MRRSNPPFSRSDNLAAHQYYATGRRKESTARVFLRPGNGTITSNRFGIAGGNGFEPKEALDRVQMIDNGAVLSD